MVSIPIPLNKWLSKLPAPHTKQPSDVILGLSTIMLIICTLTTPHTGGWKLFRMGIVTPFAIGVFVYLTFVQIEADEMTHWGTSILFSIFVMRLFEYFFFFSPEEHCHRMIPKSRLHSQIKSIKSNGLESGEKAEHLTLTTNEEDDILVPEPVPAPFTLEKFYWAWSLWWSYRGIGWNFQCPLPSSSLAEPYTRKSTRKEWWFKTAKFYLLAYLLDDFFRSIRNIYAADFFSGQRSYDDLSQFERGLFSTAVVIRVWYGLNNSWCATALMFVPLGYYMGWEGELTTPWGWPPMFGALSNLWKHPGLSTMWSKTWHGYNRRWLYVLGWIGIGENVLGLTHTGISSHPTIPEQLQKLHTKNGHHQALNNSPNQSGQVTPSHPIPTSITKNSGKNEGLPIRRKMSTKLMIQNLIKSFITFLLSGLNHDFGSLALLVKNYPWQTKPVYLGDILRLTPFFIVQPIGLTIEAIIKINYRRFKSTYLRGSKPEPAWLTFLERLIGFIWTWIWLGYTARPFVEGMVQLGAYRRDGGRQLFPSIFGGLIWGKWWI
ncbi:uncharacterized protein L201_007907 [Kwoniella dendrophila CBS 6074]|uniref:Wax synthase domain-containing protein n=1 Tax=Kwoniella dendrophila CBS 6074 TaxID=1295534 RepID=A0AAX4K745_9TREE